MDVNQADVASFWVIMDCFGTMSSPYSPLKDFWANLSGKGATDGLQQGIGPTNFFFNCVRSYTVHNPQPKHLAHRLWYCSSPVIVLEIGVHPKTLTK